MKSTDLSVIILTFNEEIHIKRCILNAQKFATHIFVVDSFSNDKTLEIANSLGAETIQHKFINQAKQFKWALANLAITTKWIMRLDADEFLSDNLIEEIITKLPSEPEDVTGIELTRNVIFLGKTLKHASSSVVLLRIFKNGYGEMEDRMMDEQLILKSGRLVHYQHPFYDNNLNDISCWAKKHIDYSKREVAETLNTTYLFINNKKEGELTDKTSSKRKAKGMYYKLPAFHRSFAYFFYRYIIKCGFLDGRIGFLWCFFQAWWYRTLIDTELLQIKQSCGDDRERIKSYILNHYGITFNSEKTLGK